MDKRFHNLKQFICFTPYMEANFLNLYKFKLRLSADNKIIHEHTSFFTSTKKELKIETYKDEIKTV